MQESNFQFFPILSNVFFTIRCQKEGEKSVKPALTSVGPVRHRPAHASRIDRHFFRFISDFCYGYARLRREKAFQRIESAENRIFHAPSTVWEHVWGEVASCQPKSVDSHDAKNRQRPCHMIIRHEKNPLSVCLTWMLSEKLNPSTENDEETVAVFAEKLNMKDACIMLAVAWNLLERQSQKNAWNKLWPDLEGEKDFNDDHREENTGFVQSILGFQV
ncbi:uncharacterized protein TNCV_4776721 [Trichonephila clavipes]|nr:uncharacterized protein TNCV_4776721 [Trichonephila clavipes]